MKNLIIKLIKLYQKYISPDHSFWAKSLNKPPYCKHIPSCSEYMIEAVEKKGILIGVFKGMIRIFKCMPFTKGGYDPVCKEEKNNKLLIKNKSMTNYLNNIKYKKTFIFLLLLILFYCFLIIFARQIQYTTTFPAVVIKNQDKLGGTKSTLKFEEINLKSKDGYNINGLYAGIGSEKTIFYFHGNGGPINYFFPEIEYLNSLGYNVIAYDYPGYGKSEGKPYKKIIDEFSSIFYEYAKEQYNIENKKLIVWGYSIGTAVAVDFASKNEFDKLVLVSPLSSRYDMSRKIFGFALQKILFLPDSYYSKDVVKNFTRPVLIIHGNSDKIVPYEQGQKVFENYGVSFKQNNYKGFITINNFGHNYIINEYGEVLKNYFLDFLKNSKLDFKELFLDQEKIEEIKKQNKKNDIFSLDFKTDNSITKFINNNISFKEKSYIPNDLESIKSDYIFDTKGYGQLRKKANNALQNLAKDFYLEFDVKLKIVSSYRSYNYQTGIKNRGCPDNLCAKAGYSEHQSGLAVDIFAATSKNDWINNKAYFSYYNWFKVNAYKYGFHNTYQKGVQIDGYEIEPWHWRYLGVPLAKYLLDNNITIAEFYNNKILSGVSIKG